MSCLCSQAFSYLLPHLNSLHLCRLSVDRNMSQEVKWSIQVTAKIAPCLEAFATSLIYSFEWGTVTNAMFPLQFCMQKSSQNPQANNKLHELIFAYYILSIAIWIEYSGIQSGLKIIELTFGQGLFLASSLDALWDDLICTLRWKMKSENSHQLKDQCLWYRSIEHQLPHFCYLFIHSDGMEASAAKI